MIAAERRENGNIEVALIDAVQRKAVRGGLDHGVIAPGIDHCRQVLLNVRRLQRRHVTIVEDVIAIATEGDASPVARRLACAFQHVCACVHGRGPPSRASYPVCPDPPPRPAGAPSRPCAARPPVGRHADDDEVSL